MLENERTNAEVDKEEDKLEIHLLATATRTAATLEEYINSRLAEGATKAAIKAELLTDLETGGRIFGEFKNSIRATAHGNLRRLADIGNYSEIGDVKYKWIAILDDNTCPDCEPRHYEIAQTWQEWEIRGLPRSSNLRCRQRCRCVLVDENIKGVKPVRRRRRK